jgi:hypothetical protein
MDKTASEIQARGAAAMLNGDATSATMRAPQGPRAPHLPLAPLYERTNRRGERYLVGRIGNLKLMILLTNAVSKGDRVWQAYITEGVHNAPASTTAQVREF